MAVEDEIINIADLDVGTELLKTDKLLIETNNGTKLLDFKDFVIGPDNISSVRDDQIEYETTGEAATRNSSTSFSIVSGFKILTTTPFNDYRQEHFKKFRDIMVYFYERYKPFDPWDPNHPFNHIDSEEWETLGIWITGDLQPFQGKETNGDSL